MANEKRIMDGFALLDKVLSYYTECERNGKLMHASCEIKQKIADMVYEAPTVDAVEVVRCKECRWGKPYNRNDGEIGYYCGFCGHSFKYGTAWERVYEPIKEAEDFCSYGERREGE